MKLEFSKVVNLKGVAEKAKVPYMKMYHNMIGEYNSLTNAEKTKIHNATFPLVRKFFNSIGFDVSTKRLTDE